MPSLAQWLWPAVSALLAALWLWTLLRQRADPRTTGRLSITDDQALGLHEQRVEAEDVLKAAYVLQEEQENLSADALAQATDLPEVVARQALDALLAFGWAEKVGEGGMELTGEGTTRAQDLIRAHRLWERYLVDREGMSLDAVHTEAHRREHSTTQEDLERLDAELGHPAWDPHGHAIPGPKARVPSLPGRPLSHLESGAEAEPGDRLRVVCVDDDPAPLLAQLVAMGLTPGVEVKVVDTEPNLVRLKVDGDVIPLASAAAERVFVVPAPALPLALGTLPPGSQARVVEVQGGGKHQRRMLDMGFVPGAGVGVVRKAPLGDPIEYTVKGASVALRQREANTILVEELEHD